MRDINLLPKAKSASVKKDKTNRLVHTIIIFFAIAMLSFAAFGVLHYLEDNDSKNDQAAGARIKKYSTVYETKKNIAQHQNRVKSMNDVLSAQAKGNPSNILILDSITKAMPDDVFAVSYAVSAAEGVSMTCISKEKESAAYFLYNLKQTGVFSDIKILNLSSKTDEKGNSQENMFALTLKLKK